MRLLNKVLRRFQPRSIDDPTFGRLLFMSVKHDASKSYWEGEWTFPPTGTAISIGLPGGEEGPLAESRAFFIDMPGRFDGVLKAVRPALDSVFREWLGRPINEDIWSDVQLAGFGLENPMAAPVEWDIGFETTGEKWLGITVPFVGDSPQTPVVDT